MLRLRRESARHPHERQQCPGFDPAIVGARRFVFSSSAGLGRRVFQRDLHIGWLRRAQNLQSGVQQVDRSGRYRQGDETKIAVARPQERKFLRFSFSAGPEIRRRIAPKAKERFEERIREITGYAKGVSFDQMMAKLAPYMRGWRGYFGFYETPRVLTQLTCWVRRRLRAALWRQWKTQRCRRAMLLQLGVRGALVSSTATSSRGPWHLSKPARAVFRSYDACFRDRGLPSLFGQC
jgi:RNA-directed DNA polymerase